MTVWPARLADAARSGVSEAVVCSSVLARVYAASSGVAAEERTEHETGRRVRGYDALVRKPAQWYAHAEPVAITTALAGVYSCRCRSPVLLGANQGRR